MEERVIRLEKLLLKALEIETKEEATIKCCQITLDKELKDFLKIKFAINETIITKTVQQIENKEIPTILSINNITEKQIILLKSIGLNQIIISQQEYNELEKYSEQLSIIKKYIQIIIKKEESKEERKENEQKEEKKEEKQQENKEENAYIPPALRKQNYKHNSNFTTNNRPIQKQQPKQIPLIYDTKHETETILKITGVQSMNIVYIMDQNSGTFQGLLKVFNSIKKGLIIYKLNVNNTFTSFATYHSHFPTQMGKAISDGSEYVFSIVNDKIKPYKYSVKPFNQTMMIKDDRICIFALGTFVKNHLIRCNGDMKTIFNVPFDKNPFIEGGENKNLGIENGWISLSIVELK